MEKPGFTLTGVPGHRKALIETARELDRRGFPHVYCPSRGDGLGLCLAIAQATGRMMIGSGIANIYLRHPSDVAETAMLIDEISDGRFRLGLGVSHPTANEPLNVSVGKPLGDMRTYVERIRQAAADQPFPPIVIAALRRKMTQLAGQIAEGVLWAQAALSHMPASLQQIPAEKMASLIVGNLAPCAVSDDRPLALGAIQRGLRLYMALPNYQNYFIEAGYEEEVERARAAVAAHDNAALLNSVSERMAGDIGLFGTAAQVREKVEAWREAGVQDITLGAISTTGNQARAIEEVAAIFD